MLSCPWSVVGVTEAEPDEAPAAADMAAPAAAERSAVWARAASLQRRSRGGVQGGWQGVIGGPGLKQTQRGHGAAAARGATNHTSRAGGSGERRAGRLRRHTIHGESLLQRATGGVEGSAQILEGCLCMYTCIDACTCGGQGERAPGTAGG